MNPSPKLLKCACGEPVLVGWDRDMCALQITVDVYPITAAGELAAIRESKRTFRYRQAKLMERDQWNMPGNIPGHELLILAQHRCGSFVDPAHRLPKLPTQPQAYESAVLPF